MTFLNPFVLIGLAAAAIPIILHLLNLRKLRTIEFSTLTFLKELQQTKIRRLKLRQLLLLITRTLLIIFIILAFARPALKGSFAGSLGSHARTSMVLILDDSFSMSVNDEHGDRFKQAKEAAYRTIDLLKEGDEVYLIKLSDVPEATVFPATHDFTAIRTIIAESQISYVSRSIDDALRLAAKSLQHSVNANKEVYIISDLQRTLFTYNQPQTQEDALKLFDERDNFFFLPIGDKVISNAGIDSVNVVTVILEKDKPATVYTSIKNFSNVSTSNTVAGVYLDNIRVAQRNISADAWSSASIELSFTPKHTGFTEGYVEIENDAIDIDNKRFFTLFIPPKINVALVGESDADTKFISLALNPEGDENNSSLFSVKQIQAQRFPLLDLKGVDVLICSGVRSFSESDAQRIKSFIEQGGGLVFFPGDATDIQNLNSTLVNIVGLPPVVGFNGNNNPQFGISFDKVDYDHPIFSSIFEKEQSKISQQNQTLGSPSIYKTLRYRPDKKSHSIITLSDGSPLLLEQLNAKGKILSYSIAPNLIWTDFPLKGIFAPLIYRSVIYSASHEENQYSFTTGDIPNLSLRNKFYIDNIESRITDRHFRLISPDNNEQNLLPTAAMKSLADVNTILVFPLQKLTLPGIYKIMYGSTLISLFSVNINPIESDTRKISEDDLYNSIQHLGINSNAARIVPPGEQFQAKILQSRFGIELWKYCIGLTLILALLEMFLARDSRKSQQPS